MNFLLSTMSVVYVLTTPMPKDGEIATMEQIRKRSKWKNDDYVCRGIILNDFKHTLKHKKNELTLVELDSHMRIKESLKVHDNDKPKGNYVVGPLVINMMEHHNPSRYIDYKGKRKHQADTKADPTKKSKVTCWKCGKPGHFKKNCKGGKDGNKVNGSGINGSVNDSSNSLKGRICLINIFRMMMMLRDLRFSSGKIVPLFNVVHVPNIRKNLVSSSVLNNFGLILLVILTMGTHDDEAGSSRSKCSRQYEIVEEAMLSRVHHPYLLCEGCNQAARSRYNIRLAQLLLRLIYSPCVMDLNVLNQMGYGEAIDEILTIKLCVASTNEEIFTSEAWTNAFIIDE
ncbi:zinc finger, CCHC-type containing protein [Tanacetum coccineum]